MIILEVAVSLWCCQLNCIIKRGVCNIQSTFTDNGWSNYQKHSCPQNIFPYCSPAGVSARHYFKTLRNRVATGLLSEIRHQKSSAKPQHKPDTLASIQLLDPCCTRQSYESFGCGKDWRHQFHNRKRKRERSIPGFIL